jgi:hypothetical protein
MNFNKILILVSLRNRGGVYLRVKNCRPILNDKNSATTCISHSSIYPTIYTFYFYRTLSQGTYAT